MPGINGTLEMARRALLTQQAALGVTGENIANVNTAGYARRRANLTPGPTLNTPEGTYGSGVVVSSISSTRDPFIERQIRRAMGDSGRYGEAGQQLQIIEGMVDELGDTGLTATLDTFWNSWHDLAADPTSVGARTLVKQAATGLVNRFQSLNANLNNQFNEINQQIIEKINRTNSLLNQLAQMNGEMLHHSVGGEIDDGRAAVLDELATLTSATYTQTQDGSITLVVGGFSLVEGRQVRQLSYQLDNAGNPVIQPLTPGGASPRITTGEIAGLISVRENELMGLKDNLDRIAVTLASEVNRIHSTGYDAGGRAAGVFFDENITGIGDFSLSETILNDSGRIAASAEAGSGDNSIALALAELQTTALIDGETIGEALTATVAELGAKIQENQLFNQAAISSLGQMESYRESVSGVSVDEEMANLLKFENAYNAAAKLTQVISEMLDTILTIQ